MPMRVTNNVIQIFTDSNIIEGAALANDVNQYDWVIIQNGLWIKCPPGHYPKGVVENKDKGIIRFWGVMRYPNTQKGKFYYIDGYNAGKLSEEINGMPIAYGCGEWKIYVLLQSQYEINNLLPIRDLADDVEVFDLVVQDYRTGRWYKCPPDVTPIGVLQTPAYVRHYGLMYYPGVKQGKIYYQDTTKAGKISDIGTKRIGYAPYDDYLLVGINVNFDNWLGPSAPPSTLPTGWDFDNLDWTYSSIYTAMDFENNWDYKSSLYQTDFDIISYGENLYSVGFEGISYSGDLYSADFRSSDFIRAPELYTQFFEKGFSYIADIYQDNYESQPQESSILLNITSNYAANFTKQEGDDFTEIDISGFNNNKGFQAPDNTSKYYHNNFDDGHCRFKFKVKMENRNYFVLDFYCGISGDTFNLVQIDVELSRIRVYKDNILLSEEQLYRPLFEDDTIYNFTIDLYESLIICYMDYTPLITVTHENIYPSGNFGFGKPRNSQYNHFVIGDFIVLSLS